MRFRRIMCILGLTVSLAFVGGCSGNKAEKEPGQETEEQQEPEAPAESPDMDEETGDQDEAVSDVPVRIYGVVQEIGEDTVMVDNQSENSSAGEIILTIDPESTMLVDGQTGLPITLADMETGSFEAYLGPVMTMSLPPQTTPYVVIANIPEDAAAPVYVIAAQDAVSADGVYTLEGTDGSSWEIPEDADIQPFRTRNIVTVADITEGRGCLIWQDGQGTVTKVVLFEV